MTDSSGLERDELESLRTIISHDVAAPIGYLRNLIELLEEEPDRVAGLLTTMIKSLAAIERSSRAAERWLAAVMARPETTSVSELVSKACAEMGDTEIVVDVPVDRTMRLPERGVILVVQELLENAVRHAPVPPATLHVHAVLTEGQLVIEVQDTGSGVDGPVDQLTELGRTLVPGGSGIGLALADRMTRRWGGELRLTSDPGAGFTATVVIPVGNDDERDAA